MKTGLKILLLLFLLIQSSCEDTIIYDCEDCNEKEPYDCELSIKLSSFSATDYYHLTIYQGKIEDDIVIYDGVERLESIKIRVPLNAEYSVKAVYTKGERLFISINSIFPKVEYREDYCDVPCYFIKDYKVDMRIKYY